MSMSQPSGPSGPSGPPDLSAVMSTPSHSPSASQRAQIQRLVNNYKLTPATLMARLDSSWIPSPFLQYISAEIARAVTQGRCGLLVSAPPRHGKSRLITIATPIWVLENFPHKNVIVATYGEELSTDFTREVKDFIKSNPDLLSIKIRRDVDRVSNFVTPQGGGLKAVGLRGTITGRGADVLIIDDYIKEPKEALSFDYLEGIKTWYATVARTRLEPGAVVIIVATRWVVNDLHGHIERLEKSRPPEKRFYKQIRVQAISGKWDKNLQRWVDDPKNPDIMGRPPGTALFPQRYDLDALETLRSELTNRWFEAMFQQNPTSEDSSVTNPENLRYIAREDFRELLKRGHNMPGRFRWRRAWDFASTKNAGDFTASPLTMYDTQTEAFYITSMKRGQWSAGRVELEFVKASGDEALGGDDPEVELVLEQESGSQGKFAVNRFKEMAPNRKVRIVNAAAEGSKLLKANPFISATEKAQVYLVVDNVEDHSDTPWVQPFVDEFTTFPEGGHDDQMDAVSAAYNDASGKKPFSAAWGRDKATQNRKEALKNGATAVTQRTGRVGGATWGARARGGTNSTVGKSKMKSDMWTAGRRR